MSAFLSYVLIFVISIFVVACGGRGVVEEEVTVESVGGVAGSEGVTVSTIGLDDADNTSELGADELGTDADLLGKQVIYFEYDSSALSAEGEAIAQAHAQYLNSAPGVQVILEGHADERGTREYNLALGEDRARTVANVLQALGVSSGRIQSISYGEERPVAPGVDESAWYLNRRVEILYQ